jgi:TP901 family phage tail tape measure protein
MAKEKIVSLRVKLIGDEAAVNKLSAIPVPLEESSRLLTDIQKKSKNLDALTRKVNALQKKLDTINKGLGSGVSDTSGKTSSSPSSKTTSNETAEQKKLLQQIKEVRAEQARLRAELQLTGDKGSESYKKTLQKVVEYKTQQKQLNEEIRRQQKEFENIGQSITSYNSLNATLGKLRNTYRLMSEEQRNSIEGKQLNNDIRQLDAQLKKIDASMGIYVRNVGNYASALQGLRTVSQQFLQVAGIATGAAELVAENAKISDSLADVKRNAQLTVPELNELAKVLKGFDSRTSLAELLSFGNIGGKLGIEQSGLPDFIKASDQLKVALGGELGNDVEGIVNNLGRIVTVFEKDGKITGDRLRYVGNSVLYLSNQGSASGDFLVDFTQRLAGLKGIAPVTVGQLLGIGAAFQETGQSAEVSSTAVNGLILKLGSDVPKFAALAGKSADEFAKTLNGNPVEALIQLAEGLQNNKDGFTEIAEAFADAEGGGKRVATVLGVLGSKAELFRTRIEQGTKAYGEQNLIIQAFEEKNKTLGAEIDKLKNSLINLTVNTEFQTFLAGAIDLIVRVINALGNLPALLRDNKAEFIALGTAILLFNKQAVGAAVQAIQASVAYQALTSATKRAELATRLLSQAQKAIPILLIVAGVYAIVKAFQAYTENIDKGTAATRALRDAQKEIAEETANEFGALSRGLERLKDVNLAYDERKKVIDSLLKQYPDYLKGINLESLSVSQLTKLQNSLNEAIIQGIAERKKSALQDAELSKAVEARLKLQEVERKGFEALTFWERQREDVLGVAGRKRGETGQQFAVRAKKEELLAEIAAAEKASNEIAKEFDKAFNLNASVDPAEIRAREEEALDALNDGARKTIDLRKLTNEELESLDTKAAKEELKRRNALDKELGKAEKVRLKQEKTIADTIIALQEQVLQKTFEGRKQLEVEKAGKAIDALVGTPDEIQQATDLIIQVMRDNVKRIADEQKQAIEDAQNELSEFSRRSVEANARGTFSAIRGDRAFNDQRAGISAEKSRGDFNSTVTELQRQLEAQTILQGEYDARVKEAQIKLNQDLADIEAERLALDKKLLNDELAARIELQKAQFESEKLQIDQQETERAERLRASLEAGLLTEQEYQQASAENKAAFEQQRRDAEAEYYNEQIGVVQEASLALLESERVLAEQQMALADEVNQHKIDKAQEAAEAQREINAAQLDLLTSFVTGARSLLEQDVNARRKYGGILKALAIAEIAINLQREIQNINLAASQALVATFGLGAPAVEVLRALKILAAVANAGFATARIISTNFEYGGAIPVDGGSGVPKEGMIKGPSHSQGGVKALIGNRPVEFEGNEMLLRNGPEIYVINKKSSRKFRPQLEGLKGNPRQFNPRKRALAEAANTYNGWGRSFGSRSYKFADGGAIQDKYLSISPVYAPRLNAGDSSAAIAQLANNAAQLAAAANDRIDRLVVVLDAEKAYTDGKKRNEVKNTRVTP